MKIKTALFLFYTILISTTANAATQKISYAELAARITDLDALATAPAAGEKTASQTSHDTRATFDGAKYIEWYANDDGKGYIRKEGEDTVIADIKGPGVIWRIWTAQAEKGDIKIYIDGAKTPALQMPFNRIFDNTKAPFAFSNLNVKMAAGFNLFVPIPFQKSIKISLAPGWGNYFQATYSTFPNDTEIPSFTGAFNAEETAALARANQIIAERNDPALLIPENAETISKNISLAAGGSYAETLAGAGKIVNITAKIHGEHSREALAKILRECTISIAWDGEKSPSVWSPLGDFFGAANGINPFYSLPLAVCDNGAMVARWRMPFSDGAQITLQNDGKNKIEISLSVSTVKIDKSEADALLRFHAKWHRNNFGNRGEAFYKSQRWPDWPMLLAEGAGRYVGMSIDIWNPNSNWNADHKRLYERPEPDGVALPQEIRHGILNDWWWGEGDEKFFVDGEAFPSTFGTGFEDYIGYAWGTPNFFDSHSQVQSQNDGNSGHICIARFHIADNVPFQKTFEAAVEKYHGDNWPLQFAITAYWYQQKNVSDIYKALPLKERVGAEKSPKLRADVNKADMPFRTRALIDGVKFRDFKGMRVLNKSDDMHTDIQDMSHWGANNWTDGRQILLGGFTLGKTITFEADAFENGAQNITIAYTQAPDYADFDILVNGKESAAEISGYAPDVRAAKITLPEKFAPENGKFKITVRAISNDRGTLGGIDRIEFGK